MLNKAVFAAGGTGGHIYPAIAVADELKKMNENIQICFVGAKGRIEEKIVPDCGYELKTLDLRGFYRSISPKNLIVSVKFLKASRIAKSFLSEFQPEVVFGTGGFVSGPVLWSSSKLGIPSVIQEGNSQPGMTVKWLSKSMDKVILNFEETKSYLKKQDNIEVLPYPVRGSLKRYTKQEAGNYFGLRESGRTLFVFGGSQGANTINKALLECWSVLVQGGIQIIWQTGDRDFDTISREIKDTPGIRAMKYLDHIDYAYSLADLIVCRAGISTVMELASFGCAALFVPYSHASGNHQEKNAKTLVDKGAAEMILDGELNMELKRKILSLINDEARLEEMKNNIKRLANPNAAKQIADLLLQLAKNSKN